MFVNLSGLIAPNQKIAVALSGGADSMALIHYLNTNAKSLGITVVAINVEHGIRGESSIRDSAFVVDYCAKHAIPLKTYAVDCLAESKAQKLSLEQVARKLRYQCFYDAIESGFCDKVATAHHSDDNFESVLFNLLRGSGAKGLIGIEPNYKNKIIRPFLSVSKQDILDYAKEHGLSYVTDATNFDESYTRNNLRLNVIPQIKKVFPEALKSINRYTEIARIEDEYLDQLASKQLIYEGQLVCLTLPCPQALFSRACITAMQSLGIKKDWEKAHIDAVFSLCENQTGASCNLPNGVVAVKEYGRIVFYKPNPQVDLTISFTVGDFNFNGNTISVKKVDKDVDLKSGLFVDFDKIPKTALVRNYRPKDEFTKFGGGTKSLGDYFTDLKLPVRERSFVPLLADGNKVLAIFGMAISDHVKVDNTTENVVQLILKS